VDLDLSLGGGYALLSRILRRCLTERTGERLEDAFTDMMGFIAVYLAEMYVETTFNGYGTEELLKKLDLEIADHHMLLARNEHHERPAAKVDGSLAKGLIHWNGRKTVASDTLAVAQSLIESLSEHKPYIFNRMMVIDIKIAVSLDGEIYQRMLFEKIKHMVEETNARIDGALAASIEIEAQGNPGLLRVPLYRSFSHDKNSLLRELYHMQANYRPCHDGL
jgi:hypothetical protein